MHLKNTIMPPGFLLKNLCEGPSQLQFSHIFAENSWDNGKLEYAWVLNFFRRIYTETKAKITGLIFNHDMYKTYQLLYSFNYAIHT